MATYLYPGVSLSEQFVISKQGRNFPPSHIPPSCIFCGKFMREIRVEVKQEGRIIFRDPPFKTFICDKRALNHVFIRELPQQVLFHDVEIPHKHITDYGDLCEACHHLLDSECHSNRTGSY